MLQLLYRASHTAIFFMILSKKQKAQCSKYWKKKVLQCCMESVLLIYFCEFWLTCPWQSILNTEENSFTVLCRANITTVFLRGLDKKKWMIQKIEMQVWRESIPWMVWKIDEILKEDTKHWELLKDRIWTFKWDISKRRLVKWT